MQIVYLRPTVTDTEDDVRNSAVSLGIRFNKRLSHWASPHTSTSDVASACNMSVFIITNTASVEWKSHEIIIIVDNA